MALPPHPGAGFPQVSSAELRPKKGWIFLSVAFMLVGVLLAMFAFVSLFVETSRSEPKTEDTFRADESILVELEAGETRTIYAKGPNAAEPVECSVELRDASNNVTLDDYTAKITVNGWVARFDVETTDSGEYRVSCEGLGSDVIYGIGEPFSFLKLLIFLPIASLLFLAGLVMLIVTLVRRANFKKHLTHQRLAQVQQYPAQGFPPQGYPPAPGNY